MGHIHIDEFSFFEMLSEVIGFKTGVGLDKNDIQRLLEANGNYDEFLTLEDGDYLRLESTEVEEVVEYLLYRLGRLKQPRNPMPIVGLYHKYKRSPDKLEVLQIVQNSWITFLNEALEEPNLNKIDPSPFLVAMKEQYGLGGLGIAIEVVEAFDVQLYKSPWGRMTTSEWKNVIELKALFNEEGLEPFYGSFIDQRFIDYLMRNFDDIDRINWRKFEGLTAEYFERSGFSVSLGPGRGDDGIDVRVWPTDDDPIKPPAILIQCKREARPIQKVVVKALYADVINEGATSGLVVTTSRLAPGAKKLCQVRNYPIDEADRSSLKTWIEALHQPGSRPPV